MPEALNSIRTLLCTATNQTPHSRFFNFDRRSHHGKSLPEWLCKPGPVLLRKFVRSGKNDDLVRKVDLIEANPMYARIRYRDGRESNVSLRDLARCPNENGGMVSDRSGFVPSGGSRAEPSIPTTPEIIEENPDQEGNGVQGQGAVSNSDVPNVEPDIVDNNECLDQCFSTFFWNSSHFSSQILHSSRNFFKIGISILSKI